VKNKINIVLEQRDFLFKYLKRKFRYIRIDDIDDIVQMALIKACRKVDTMQDRSTIRTWVTKIAVNDAIDFIRRNKNKISSLSEFNIEEKDRSDLLDNFNNYDPIENIISCHVIDQILTHKLDILKKSNPTAYQTFIAYINLDDYKKVQEAENISMGTVKSRIFRAREILQRNFNDEELALLSV
jgi:RNA polymerase sigma-70 factor (ECF subfamily)